MIMQKGVVLIERAGDGIAYVTLNRPERLNAINGELRTELVRAVHTLGDDADTRVIIIRGAGRAFSVGNDVHPTSGNRRGRDTIEEHIRVRQTLLDMLTIWDCPKPVIAQVHGYCIGTAFVLCVFCDFVVVAEDAVLGWPGVPTGGGYLSPIAFWVLGARKAREFSYLVGTRFSGKESVVLGWANHAVPAACLEEETLRYARRMAMVPPGIMRLKKEANNKVLERLGFRDTVLMGGEFDAIGHMSDEGRALTEEIKQRGYKAVAARYQQ